MGSNRGVPFFWSKCLLSCCFNIAILVIGIVLYLGDTSQYGQVIDYEMSEWNLKAIEDVIAVEANVCPESYNKVSGWFYGTETICRKLGDYYFLGPCGRRETGLTRYGMSDEELTKFDGRRICVKRSNYTYHDLVGMRETRDKCA